MVFIILCCIQTRSNVPGCTARCRLINPCAKVTTHDSAAQVEIFQLTRRETSLQGSRPSRSLPQAGNCINFQCRLVTRTGRCCTWSAYRVRVPLKIQKNCTKPTLPNQQYDRPVESARSGRPESRDNTPTSSCMHREERRRGREEREVESPNIATGKWDREQLTKCFSQWEVGSNRLPPLLIQVHF